MMPLRTISAGVVGTALAGLAGWVGVTSVDSIIAPQGDFSFLGEVSRTVSDASGTAPASSYTASVIETAPLIITNKTKAVKIVAAQISETSVPTTTASTTHGDEIQKCSYATNQFPNYNRLNINEVAWMGTKADSSNEWIELKNTGAEPIEIEGYQIIDKAEQIKITLPKSTLAPGGFYLLERAEEGDQVLPESLAYTGALSNSNEGLRLFDRHCFLVDQIEASPKWPAGDAASKKSMERGGGMNWYTYNGTTVDGLLGTPGKVNTAPMTVVSEAEIAALANAGAKESAGSQPQSTSPEAAPPVDPLPAVPISEKLLISKVQITGGPGKTTEDFVEFYNPGPGQFNLKGYRLVKRTKTGATDTSIKSWTADAIIAESVVYRWANTTYPGSADMRTSGSIADDNAVALRKGAEDTGEVIDAVGWGAAANALVEGSPVAINPAAGQVLVRKNNQDTNNNLADFEMQ